MATININPFGEIDTEKVKNRYTAFITIDDHKVSLDLNFDLLQTEPDLPTIINNFIANIATFHKQNLKAIKEDYKNDGEALEYIQFFIEEYSPEELNHILGNSQKTSSAVNLLLEALTLLRIGIYPDNEEGFKAVFDYSILEDGKPNNQVLAINTNDEGEIGYISWES